MLVAFQIPVICLETLFERFCAGVSVPQTVGNCSGLVQKVCQQFNAVDDAIYTQQLADENTAAYCFFTRRVTTARPADVAT